MLGAEVERLPLMLHTVLTGRGVDVHATHGILDQGRELLRGVLRVTVHDDHYTPLGYPIKATANPARDGSRAALPTSCDGGAPDRPDQGQSRDRPRGTGASHHGPFPAS